MNTSRPITRRDFLNTSSAAATTALGTLALDRSVHAAGSDIIRLGMIGCGGRNTGAGAQVLRADPGAHLVAMCDIFSERVRGARGAIKGALSNLGRPEQIQVPDDACFTGFDS